MKYWARYSSQPVCCWLLINYLAWFCSLTVIILHPKKSGRCSNLTDAWKHQNISLHISKQWGEIKLIQKISNVSVGSVLSKSITKHSQKHTNHWYFFSSSIKRVKVVLYFFNKQHLIFIIASCVFIVSFKKYVRGYQKVYRFFGGKERRGFFSSISIEKD